MRHARGVVPLTLMLLACASARAAEWPTAAPAPDHVVAARSLRAFAGAVAASSGVRLTMLPAAPADAAGALAAGEVTVAAFPLARLEADDPVLAMDRIPYLATSFVDARKLWQVLRPRVERSLEERGMVLLFAVPSPPPAPLSVRPMTSVAAFRGAALAVSEPALGSLSRSLGAKPVPAPAPHEALRAGEAEVAFQSAAAAARARAWEYARHYLHAPAWFPKQLVVASRRAVQALAPAAREAVMRAARDTAEAAWETSQRETTAGVQKLRDYGMKTDEVPVAMLIQLEEVGRELLLEWSEGAGEAGARLVEAYYELR